MLREAIRRAPLAACIAVACGVPLEVITREPDRPIQTDRLGYELRSGEGGYEVEIPFAYTNRTGETVYVVNCNRSLAISLEKEVAGEWVRAWTPVAPLCLSEPIAIPAGATYEDTLAVFAGHPSNDVHPKFAGDGEPEGTYRLVWYGLVHDYDPDRPGFGEPVPPEGTVSNRFALER